MLRCALLLSCFIMLSPAVCLSEYRYDSQVDQEIFSYCQIVEKWAIQMMRGRQSGISLSDVLSRLEDNSGRTRDIAFDAYKEHRVVGAELKASIITDFGNKWFKRCMLYPESFLPYLPKLLHKKPRMVPPAPAVPR